MISAKFRDRLSLFSLLVMIGGSILGLLAFVGAVAIAVDNGADVATVVGRALAASVKFAVACILAGGALRLLVSIDARLEARA
tara:strand:- start:228 stop:476 length:249 start_codon:yes stop_codon:yes gene_type:complete